MAQTTIRGKQITDGSVQRVDLDTTTSGQSVVSKIIQGSNITLSSTGADAGTGDVTVAATIQGPSADAGNLITTGSDSLHYSGASQIQPTIWSARLRSWNAVGNPSFEVDQRNCFAAVANIGNVFLCDRWSFYSVGTMKANAQASLGHTVVVPGTSYCISQGWLYITVATTEAALAAGDVFEIQQSIEGPLWRELFNDVTSLSLLVQSTVANLNFSVALRSSNADRSLVHLCNIPSANTWTLITIPNIPKPTSGTFPLSPGSAAYQLSICLAAGATATAPSADVWNAGNYVAASGTSNLFATAGAGFQIAFIQHEPGSQCTTLMDCPFGVNLDGPMGCTRYYAKSYPYGTAVGTATQSGCASFVAIANNLGWPQGNVSFPKVMAKIPTITMYATSTGAINSATEFGSASTVRAVNGVLGAGDRGFGGINTSTSPAAGNSMLAQWSADTGW